MRALLGAAPLIESKGRAYPVETRYVGRNPSVRIENEVARVTLDALERESGSILVFVPGQGEIRLVADILQARVRRSDVDIAPLYGGLEKRAQDLAIEPAPEGRRKIVLTTSIAETSLTIEGVRVVVDSGYMRVPVYEPDVGLTRLETVRVSRANADQRRGRAGRTEPGVCYRLWEAAANGGLQPYAAAEILSADLSALALDCALWGVADPGKLAFLDSPPRAALKAARALLTAIGALDDEGRIADEGRAIAGLALPPRLARMVIGATRVGDARTAKGRRPHLRRHLQRQRQNPRPIFPKRMRRRSQKRTICVNPNATALALRWEFRLERFNTRRPALSLAPELHAVRRPPASAGSR